MIKFNLFIFLLLFAVDYSYSKNIVGSVSDDITGEKLSEVSIYIPDINKVFSTGKNGEFKLTGLPDAVLKLQFSLLGYRSLDITLQAGSINDSLNIRLLPVEITTDEINVTGTLEQKSYQTGKVSSRDLLRYGFMNISESITKIPGVWQLSTGTGISKPVIRGLYGNRIGIMINGIRFDNQQWQDEHGLVMSSDGIDNIEVIKGPKSLLYGPEAIGGVINITDEHPAPIGSNIADLNLKFFTNTLGILADAGFKGAEKDFNWLFRFGGETHADYLDGDGNRIPQTRFGGYTLKGSTGYHKGIWSGKLNYSYTSYTYGILEAREFEKEFMKINETRFDRSFNGPRHTLKVHNIILQNTFNAGRSKFKLNTGFTYNRRLEKEGNDERFLPDSLQFGDLNMLLNTFSIDGTWSYYLKESTELSIGSQGYIQRNTNSGSRRLIPDADVTSVSATALIKHSIGTLTLDGGVRYDIYNLKSKEFGFRDSTGYFAPLELSYNSFNGSVGAVYVFTKTILAKTNISTGFRSPNLAELTSNGLHEGIFQYEIGNPDFKKEQSIEGDLAVEIKTKYVSLEAAAFYNKINNYIYLGQTTDSLRGYPVFRYFQSDASLKGLEAEINITPYKWLNIKGTYSTVIAKREDGVNLPLIPPDKVTTAIHAELKDWGVVYNPYIELSAYSSFTKTRLGENEISAPAYTIFNAAFGCDLRFEHQLLSISIACNNIFGKVYTDFMSRIKLLSANYNGKLFYANNIGRNIVIAVKIPFRLSY